MTTPTLKVKAFQNIKKTDRNTKEDEWLTNKVSSTLIDLVIYVGNERVKTTFLFLLRISVLI